MDEIASDSPFHVVLHVFVCVRYFESHKMFCQSGCVSDSVGSSIRRYLELSVLGQNAGVCILRRGKGRFIVVKEVL